MSIITVCDLGYMYIVVAGSVTTPTDNHSSVDYLSLDGLEREDSAVQPRDAFTFFRMLLVSSRIY